MMIKLKELFGFISDFEKIIHGIGFKLKLKKEIVMIENNLELMQEMVLLLMS